MPDFEIIEWCESNIVKYDCLFLRQCLRKKAYAFAADYLRLRIVNDYGGFYLDTDMKLLKSLEYIKVSHFIIGEQEPKIPNWGIFYSKKNSKLLQKCLLKYEGMYFDQFKPPVIPYFLKDIIYETKDILVYPTSVFYPMPQGVNLESYKDYIKEDTIGVHMWDFSWKKLKKERSKPIEILYRLKQLIVDALIFQYPVYYYRINFERIIRLIKR